VERTQAFNLVRATFTQPFEEARFAVFIRNVVNHLDESKKQLWTLRKAAFQDYVNHFGRLGTYTDPRGERVDVLVIHLRKDTTLARGRVTLRNFVADYLATGHGKGKAAVIAAFVSPTEDDWRLSFVKLDYSIETTPLGFVVERPQLTPALRYSYLVGANENCHTAQKQFISLLENDLADPAIETLEAAFGVERVTTEFFEQYHQLFERSRDALTEFLRGAPSVQETFEKLGVTADDFAKKLLGQVVFLYFLQKKGWFGVERGKPWGAGQRNFMRHLFKHRERYGRSAVTQGRPANFFNDILEPLFYEALASPRLDDDHYYSHFDCRIPFLNGGLFEPLYGYKWVETDVLLPDSLFSNDLPTREGDVGTGILDVFDRYNFTVNESEPLEREVAVDPEMLGKVFENLLPENLRHASGTYYTPRAIVQYMCRQALLHCLSAQAPAVPPEQITAFLHAAERFADFEATDTKAHSDKRLPEAISANAKHLDDLLAGVTVCDPAIGSGAFPVGMMHEIVRARRALTPALDKTARPAVTTREDPRSAYALKRHAIQCSLYGVDVDPGAVEIAKLRLWLSMVVDEEEIRDIQPLPNLDYKIMQGNSLLEEFDGVHLFDERLFEQAGQLRPDPRLADLLERRNWVQAEVARLQSAGLLTRKMAADFKEEAARLTREHAALQNPKVREEHPNPALPFGALESLKRIQQLHASFFDESSRVRKEAIRSELEALEWEFMRATLREQGREQALVELERASATHRKPFFLWRLQFGDVFRQRGGFDIVIANPPYVRVQELTQENPAIAARLKVLYKSAASGNYDVYVVFTELALRLLAEHGTAALIQPHKFFNAKYGQGLRRELSSGQHVEQIVYFGDQQVFEGATNYVCLLFLTKQPNAFFRYVKVEDLEKWYATTEGREKRFPATKLTDANWSIVVGRGEGLHARLSAMPRTLGDVTRRIFQGLKTSADKIYIVERRGSDGPNVRVYCRQDEREYVLDPGLLHPLIKGGDSRAYALERTDRLIMFPYARDTNGAMVLLSAAELRSRYGLTWKYLAAHQDYLRAREGGKMNHEGWYGYGRSQAFDVMSLPKIFTPDLAPRASYAFDPTGECFFTGGAAGGYGILPNEGESVSFLLALLNSPVLDWFHHQQAAPMRGGWFSYESRYIRNLPIPDADDHQKQVLECLVGYLLHLRKGEIESPALDNSTAALMAGFFEQWVNALVYQLFFSAELQAADLDFFRLADEAHLFQLPAELEAADWDRLRAEFERVYSERSPLRKALFALESLDDIRVVEGRG